MSSFITAAVVKAATLPSAAVAHDPHAPPDEPPPPSSRPIRSIMNDRYKNRAVPLVTARPVPVLLLPFEGNAGCEQGTMSTSRRGLQLVGLAGALPPASRQACPQSTPNGIGDRGASPPPPLPLGWSPAAVAAAVAAVAPTLTPPSTGAAAAAVVAAVTAAAATAAAAAATAVDAAAAAVAAKEAARTTDSAAMAAVKAAIADRKLSARVATAAGNEATEALNEGFPAEGTGDEGHPRCLVTKETDSGHAGDGGVGDCRGDSACWACRDGLRSLFASNQAMAASALRMRNRRVALWVAAVAGVDATVVLGCRAGR